MGGSSKAFACGTTSLPKHRVTSDTVLCRQAASVSREKHTLRDSCAGRSMSSPGCGSTSWNLWAVRQAGTAGEGTMRHGKCIARRCSLRAPHSGTPGAFPPSGACSGQRAAESSAQLLSAL